MEKSQKQRALKYNPLMRKRADICDNNANFHKTRGSYSTSPVHTHRSRHIFRNIFISIHNSSSRTTIYGITECLINCHGIPHKIPFDQETYVTAMQRWHREFIGLSTSFITITWLKAYSTVHEIGISIKNMYYYKPQISGQYMVHRYLP